MSWVHKPEELCDSVRKVGPRPRPRRGSGDPLQAFYLLRFISLELDKALRIVILLCIEFIHWVSTCLALCTTR